MALRWARREKERNKNRLLQQVQRQGGKVSAGSITGSLDSRDTSGAKSIGLCLWILGGRERLGG